jgi:hypothetical protein
MKACLPSTTIDLGNGVPRVGLLDGYLGVAEHGEGLVVVMLAGEAGWIEHDAHLHTPPMGLDYGMDQDRIRELEHFDIERLFGLLDGMEDRFDPVVWLDNQMMDGVGEHGAHYGGVGDGFQRLIAVSSGRLFHNQDPIAHASYPKKSPALGPCRRACVCSPLCKGFGLRSRSDR